RSRERSAGPHTCFGREDGRDKGEFKFIKPPRARFMRNSLTPCGLEGGMKPSAPPAPGTLKGTGQWTLLRHGRRTAGGRTGIAPGAAGHRRRQLVRRLRSRLIVRLIVGT